MSGWTTDTLHSHLLTLLQERSEHWNETFATMNTLIAESDRRYDARFIALGEAAKEADKRFEQRFIAQQEAIQAALLAQKEAVNAALVAADRAVVKAETASEKRFDAVNEFRATLADQAATLLPRTEGEARIQALADKLTELTDRVNRGEGIGVGKASANTAQVSTNSFVAYLLFGAFGLLVGVGGLIVAIVRP